MRLALAAPRSHPRPLALSPLPRLARLRSSEALPRPARTLARAPALVMKHQSAVVNDCAFWPLIEQLHSGRQVYNQLKSSARAYLSVSAVFDRVASCPVAGQPAVVEA